MRRLSALLLILALGLSASLPLYAQSGRGSSSSLHRKVDIRFHQLLPPDDPRQIYLEQLIRISLRKVGIDARLDLHRTAMNQDRSLRMIETGQLDIFCTMASDERIAALPAIPIPVFHGYFGQRAFLVRTSDERMADVQSLADLRRFTAVLGHDWPDVAVMQHNDLPVITGEAFSPLLELVTRGRADYFSGSVLEVGLLLEQYPEFDLRIEEGLLLRYPVAMNFFVKDDQLRHLLSAGLHKALQDGSMQALFDRHLTPLLSSMALEKRHTIDLESPFSLSPLPVDPSFGARRQ